MMLAAQTLERRAPHQRRMLPLKRTRPALQRLRADLTRTLAKFLHAQAPLLAAQVGKLRAKVGKASVTAEEKAAIDAILAQIDFTGWAVLVGDVEGAIEGVIKDSAYAALAQVGIDVQARPEILRIVDERAVAYARERGAEMVGMRVDELGRLVQNPNAFWRITEPTRDYMRADVTTAIVEGWSNDRLAAALAQAYGFSPERAMVIARTETNRAASIGALTGYKASGVVAAKQWLTAEDDLVSEECIENGAAGPGGDGVLPLEAEYPSGDEAPPVHPNCRCAIAPVVDFEAHDQAATPAVAPVALTPPPPPAKPVFAFRGGDVSDAFRAMATTFMESLPTGIAKKLSDAEIKYAFGDRMTGVAPELKGLHPRGYPAGATWDWASGAFMPDKSEIVVAEQYRVAGSKAFLTKEIADYRGTLAHETGHGIDRALAKMAGDVFYESRRPEFVAAYKKDAREIRAKFKAGKGLPHKYYMQKGDAGPSEAFAEGLGQLLNGPRYGKDFSVIFPNVTKYLEDLLLEIES